MFQRIACFIALILFTFPSASFAFQGYVQPFEDGGSIAWGSGEVAVVRVLTSGDSGKPVRPIAVRKAASQARKQMLDIIMGVRIDAKKTISGYLAGNDAMAARVRGLIQNSPFSRPAMFDEGGEVRASEFLRGKLAELVLPTTIQFQSGIAPRLSTAMEPSGESELEAVGGGAHGYTGVIVDARGMKVTPALAPVVYGQDGQGAYGPFVVGRANAVAYGVVAYATTADPAALRERVGANPLSVKALNAYGSWRTDLIISSPMARLVRAIMRPGNIVDKCRVVIVIDPKVSLEDSGQEVRDEQPTGEEQ